MLPLPVCHFIPGNTKQPTRYLINGFQSFLAAKTVKDILQNIFRILC